MRRSASGGRAVLLALVALLGVVLLQAAAPGLASAQVAPSDTPLRVRWQWPGPVDFCADTSTLPPGLTAATFRAWVQEAMDAWNGSEADVELRLSGTPCVRTDDNRRNEVGFEIYPEASSEVGRAYSSTLGSEPVEGDVTLRLNWDTLPACRVSALVHEFGHVLGFTHSEDETDIMGYGPCAVLQPSPSEVSMLAARYGTRTTPLDIVTEAPDGSSTLTLVTTQVDYPEQAGVYYYNASVALAGGGAHALRAPECHIEGSRADDECVVESMLPDGFWPAVSRQNPLAEVFQVFGQTVAEPASQFGQFARQIAACNAVGCSDPFDLRAGDVRASGSGVDFAYLAYARPDGDVSVQIANLSFYAPPDLLDVPTNFEVRRSGVAGASGRLGACTLALGETCEVAGDFAGIPLAVVVVEDTDTRTGIVLTPLEAVEGASTGGTGGTPAAGTSPIAGTLPSRGFALQVWGGGLVSALEADARVGAVFVSVDGVLRGYVSGAPAFVNAAFLAAVGEEIPAGTPVIVVVRG